MAGTYGSRTLSMREAVTMSANAGRGGEVFYWLYGRHLAPTCGVSPPPLGNFTISTLLSMCMVLLEVLVLQ